MKSARSLFPVLLLLVLALSLSACDREAPTAEPTAAPAAGEAAAPEATDEPEPTPTVVLVAIEGATLEVAVEPVALRRPGEDDAADVASGEALDLAEESAVVVGPKGVALVTWPGFLRGEMLSGADVAVAKVVPDERAVVLRQDAGTARYTLLEPDSPADVTVEAGEMTLHLGGGPADVIVSHGPEGYDTVWAVVVDGEVEVEAAKGQGETGAAGSAAAALAKKLTAGHVMANVTDVGLSKALPVDLVEVELWYGDVASGDLKRTIAEVAFRCEVVTDKVGLMANTDDGVSQIGRLSRGALVEALGRNLAGDWVLIATLAPVAEGWVPAEALACAGPTAALLLSSDELNLEAPEAVALLAEAAAEGVLPPSALATPTPSGSTSDQKGSSGDDDKHNPPPRVEPTQDPDVPTECVGPECEPPTAVPEPTRRPRPTAVPTDEPAENPTPKPTAPPKSPPPPTDEPEPTDRPEPTDTPEPTASPGVTDTPGTPAVTETPTTEPTDTPTPTPTSTSTATPTPDTPGPPPTATPSPTPTPK
ncbi:MAG: hypothetical protein ACK2T6_02700 [Anaerolineae bacterium]